MFRFSFLTCFVAAALSLPGSVAVGQLAIDTTCTPDGWSMTFADAVDFHLSIHDVLDQACDQSRCDEYGAVAGNPAPNDSGDQVIFDGQDIAFYTLALHDRDEYANMTGDDFYTALDLTCDDDIDFADIRALQILQGEPIPEPSGNALMLIGFFFLATCLRRSRRTRST